MSADGFISQGVSGMTQGITRKTKAIIMVQECILKDKAAGDIFYSGMNDILNAVGLHSKLKCLASNMLQMREN
jgi:hypothetical protein